MLSLTATTGVYAALGLLGGFAINRPAYGVGYGIGSAIMTIAMGILFGPTGYYVSIGIQIIVLVAKVAKIAEEAQIEQANLNTTLNL